MIKQITKKNITKYFFMFGAIVSAVYFWGIVFGLVSTTKSENWLAPVVIFGVMFIFWSLAIILGERKLEFFLFGVGLIFVGLIFSQDIFFIVVAILAVIILFVGTVWVHDSMKARVKLNIWMSLRLGRRLFVAAISLVVIGGFLMPVVLSGEKKTLPLVNITEKQIKLVGKAVSLFDSNLEEGGLSEMTVDEYIMKEQEGISDQHKNILGSKSISKEFTGIEKQIILTGGRESVSRLVARDVRGDEKIMNIFAEIINNKINNYFNTEVSQASGFAPLFFSVLSFFAVFSVGSFVTSLLTFLVAIIFKLLVWIKLIELGKKNVEVEVIN